MSESGTAGQAAVELYTGDEIVVATDHLARVLEALGGTAVAVDDDDRLGLTRVAVTAPEAAAARFTDVLDRTRRCMPGADRPVRADSPVEIILAGLRLGAAEQWGGWVPTIGKNRVMLGGEGTPYMVIRGDEAPVPVAAGDPVQGTGGRGVRIGLLDTPVSPHDDFAAALETGSTVLDTTDTYPYRVGHATFLAGLIARHAPEASIRTRGVLGGRDAAATAWDVAVGLLDLAESGVHAVCMSIGCFTADNRPPLVLRVAADLVRRRTMLVAASGNHGAATGDDGVTGRTPMWPAALHGVLAVGSHPTVPAADDGSSPDPVCGFTPRAPWVACTAPGQGLRSSYLSGDVYVPGGARPFGGHAAWSGSSMSAAVATARLAALAAPAGTSFAGDGPEQLANALRRSLSAGDEVLRSFTPTPAAVPA